MRFPGDGSVLLLLGLTMRPISLMLAATAYMVGAVVALAVIRGFSVGETSFAFLIGATIGTQAE